MVYSVTSDDLEGNVQIVKSIRTRSVVAIIVALTRLLWRTLVQWCRANLRGSDY